MEISEKFNILIVDDEVEVLNALKKTLQRAKEFDADVSIASNAEDAKNKLSEKDYDLVLSDYNMPNTNGVQLLTWVKENYPEVVRIIITGYSDLETAREAINQANVHNYIEKPWDNDSLREIIHQTIVRKRQREEKDLQKVQSAQDAIKTIEKLQSEVMKKYSYDKSIKQKIILSFQSPAEFNSFSFLLRDYGNVNIDDIQVFENNYIVIVSVYPKNISKIR